MKTRLALQNHEKILMIWWLPENEKFSFGIRMLLLTRFFFNYSQQTQREVLRCLVTALCPMGLITNFLEPYFVNSNTNINNYRIKLHVFVDAGESAFVAVKIIRNANVKGGNVKGTLLAAKT